ncbi:MAG: PTS sugar transporter subunit IIA [Deltaproteobacteria bacterium]|nr:PTS sugar transporter subunit IIA [Deltaproteobacteria bacterium]
MVGIVIATHARLGAALIEAVEFILEGPFEYLDFVSIDLKEDAEGLRKKIAQGIKKVNNGEGVLILTDMFGGTPSNLSLSFLEEGKIEVITGVNLPILIRSLNKREGKTLQELSQEVYNYGQKSISLASSILKGNKRAGN